MEQYVSIFLNVRASELSLHHRVFFYLGKVQKNQPNEESARATVGIGQKKYEKLGACAPNGPNVFLKTCIKNDV